MPFGWLCSITLTPYLWWEYLFWFLPSWFMLTFSGMQLRHKTRAGCLISPAVLWIIKVQSRSHNLCFMWCIKLVFCIVKFTNTNVNNGEYIYIYIYRYFLFLLLFCLHQSKAMQRHCCAYVIRKTVCILRYLTDTDFELLAFSNNTSTQKCLAEGKWQKWSKNQLCNKWVN